MNWKDITIDQLQRLYPITKRQSDNIMESLDNNIELLHVLLCESCKKKQNENCKNKEALYNSTSKQVYQLVNKYKFIFTQPEPKLQHYIFKVGGVSFRVNYEISELKGKDVIGITEIGKTEESIVANLHKIVAAYSEPIPILWIFKRRISESKKLELIKQLDVQTAVNISNFFLKLQNQLWRTSRDYFLKKAARKKMEAMNQISSNTGDGSQH